MKLSKHNIISKIKDSDQSFIVNLLSGEADILSQKEIDQFQKGHFGNREELIGKGYLVDPKEESKVYRLKYLDFIESRDTDEIQLFFVPGYACNFACSYCYQDDYLTNSGAVNEAVLEAFFSYIDTRFKNRNKYITIFGGEPLINTRNQKELFQNLINKANSRSLDIAVVTNGYHLTDYISILKKASIREVQVTLDGTKNVHDNRRMLKGGQGTFNRIVLGINQALDAGIPINLRMVVDKENIEEVVSLADFAIQQNWTQNPLFKTQLGRNYELHHCQSAQQKLYSRIELYEDLYELLKMYPQITEFHKPAFSISKFLFEHGELPDPLFDSCPGTKTEWAFDYTGKIFSCTATVGKPGEELGTFYPEVTQKNEIIEEWEDRDVLSIEECKDCSLQLACGGGCASVAKNQTGQVQSPDCRPVKELMELGIGYYFSNQLIETD